MVHRGDTDVSFRIEKKVKKMYVLLSVLLLVGLMGVHAAYAQPAPLISDHGTADLSLISETDVALAKATLHIAYGHTSHGSQLITGMTGLLSFQSGYDTLYAFNNGGTDGALDLHDYAFSSYGASDLGNPNRTAWEAATRGYLADHPDVNVVIWSWCGQADTTPENIQLYLDLMSGLEQDYPGVSFVYMTGHLNGTGETGNLHLRNEQIRNFCIANNKILYDFADIESYDPDGNYFLDKLANDECWYDSDGNGSRDKNWALDWQATHEEGVDWYNCSPAHTQALNGNLKAYAAWYLWCGIAERISGKNLAILHRDGTIWFSDSGWVTDTPPYYPGTDYARDMEMRGDGNYVILHKDGAIYDSETGWSYTWCPNPPYCWNVGCSCAWDVEYKQNGYYAILREDGALWHADTGWVATTPPYYVGSDYARALEVRDDASYVILHKEGAIYDSASGWVVTTPPYYPGVVWAVDLKLEAEGYVLLHEDGAVWSTSGGWVLGTPPYYPGTDYARALELVGSRYLILHRDGAVYDSVDGWNLDEPPYYPGTDYAVDLEVW